jgi:hypothetical protein
MPAASTCLALFVTHMSLIAVTRSLRRVPLSGSKRYAIALQSLCNRCAIAVQSPCNRLAIVVQSLCNQCAIALQSLLFYSLLVLKLIGRIRGYSYLAAPDFTPAHLFRNKLEAGVFTMNVNVLLLYAVRRSKKVGLHVHRSGWI